MHNDNNGIIVCDLRYNYLLTTLLIVQHFTNYYISILNFHKVKYLKKKLDFGCEIE